MPVSLYKTIVFIIPNQPDIKATENNAKSKTKNKNKLLSACAKTGFIIPINARRKRAKSKTTNGFFKRIQKAFLMFCIYPLKKFLLHYFDYKTYIISLHKMLRFKKAKIYIFEFLYNENLLSAYYIKRLK